MITVWGGQTSRSIRVVWVLEEMGLPYRVRQVDMLAAEQDPEFLAVNPADYIPAIQDGDVVMVESIAIMEYLMARYGPTPLAPAPQGPTFAAYQRAMERSHEGVSA
jgi:glutathione S-transferase/3-isopropylmalate dehydratase